MNEQDQSWSVAVVVPISCGYPLGPYKSLRLPYLGCVGLVVHLSGCCIVNLPWKL